MLTTTAKKVAVLLGGGTLVLLGVVLLFVPGPGILIILAGLALLATEFDWAQRHLDSLRSKTRQMLGRS